MTTTIAFSKTLAIMQGVLESDPVSFSYSFATCLLLQFG